MVKCWRLFDKKDLNAQVIALKEIILNEFRNYVPDKYITVDNKDPIWMNEIIKSKMKAKNKLYKQYIENGRFENDFAFFESLVNKTDELISKLKNVYYVNLAKRLNNPLLEAKTYCSILKTFYNNKKIPLIPPHLIDDKIVTDIQANIFNKCFADQCTPLKNNSMLTTNQLFMTQARLISLDFNVREILKIIRALNINKAHGHDHISIRMIKICDESLLKPYFI